MSGVGKVRGHEFDVWSIDHIVDTKAVYSPKLGPPTGHSIKGHWARLQGPGRFPIQEFYDPVDNKPRKRRIRVEFSDIVTILEDAQVVSFDSVERNGYRVEVALKGEPVMKNL